MARSPKAGDPYQVCPHLAATPTSPDRHFWDVPGRAPWLALCPACHAAFAERRSVEIHAEIFRLAEDFTSPSAPRVSHCAPGEVLHESAPSSPSGQPAATTARGKLLELRRQSPDPAWLPLADKALGTLTELLRTYQQHEQARETLRLQRLELENRALAQFAQALESSTRTLDALHAQAIEREQSVLDLLRRLTEAQNRPHRPRRKPAPA